MPFKQLDVFHCYLGVEREDTQKQEVCGVPPSQSVEEMIEEIIDEQEEAVENSLAGAVEQVVGDSVAGEQEVEESLAGGTEQEVQGSLAGGQGVQDNIPGGTRNITDLTEDPTDEVEDVEEVEDGLGGLKIGSVYSLPEMIEKHREQLDGEQMDEEPSTTQEGLTLEQFSQVSVQPP